MLLLFCFSDRIHPLNTSFYIVNPLICQFSKFSLISHLHNLCCHLPKNFIISPNSVNITMPKILIILVRSAKSNHFSPYSKSLNSAQFNYVSPYSKSLNSAKFNFRRFMKQQTQEELTASLNIDRAVSPYSNSLISAKVKIICSYSKSCKSAKSNYVSLYSKSLISAKVQLF